MQFNRQEDGSLADLPSKNVDTGAGFERNLLLLQDARTVFETDTLARLLDEAQRLTDTRYGADARTDVSLRILADHARTVSFLVADGVIPSNEDRGYVLRRIIRRAVRHAYLLGVESLVVPALFDTTRELMGEAYPELVRNADTITDVLAREEEGFRRTLATGLDILDRELAELGSAGTVAGRVAFTLHDTHGFPLELTQEIAGERGYDVDLEGFEVEMAAQRKRAKESRKGAGAEHLAQAADFQEVLDRFGPTEFVGREESETKATVLAVVGDSIVLDCSPFYAESGGQVGDTGTIRTDTGDARVLDTVYVLPGLHRHIVDVIEGEVTPGQAAVASIDVARRDAIRRNHTATHILHWALREVLGPHVTQQGSLVAPDRLRFDFSHFEALDADQIAAIEDLANAEILANPPVRHFETTKAHAEELGALAFFGDKYGDVVRVLEAGPHSTELCGGTHVRALGDIGPLKIVSEGSIGSNIRRVEAVTGTGPIERLRAVEARDARAAAALGIEVGELADGARVRMAELKRLQKEVDQLKRELARSQAGDLADQAVDGAIVARLDGVSRNDLREMAITLRERPGIRVVVLGGEPEGGGAALVAAAAAESGIDAGALLDGSQPLIGGGGRSNPDLTVLGGKQADGIDAALEAARARVPAPE
jgi:alanyl-tRNA synthetase